MDRGADIHIKDDDVSINNTLTENALLYIYIYECLAKFSIWINDFSSHTLWRQNHSRT